MNAKGCYRHPMNRLALGFFIAALVCFVVFNFMLIDNDFLGYRPVRKGWEVLLELKWMSTHLGSWFPPISSEQSIAICSFAMTTILALSGPILVVVFSQSRIATELLGFMSGFSILGLSWVTIIGLGDDEGSTWYWMLACQVCHFLGCLCIRRQPLEEFVPAPHPDT